MVARRRFGPTSSSAGPAAATSTVAADGAADELVRPTSGRAGRSRAGGCAAQPSASARARVEAARPRTLDSPGTTKNASSQRASASGALRYLLGRDQNASTSFSCTSQLLLTCLQKEKRASALQRATATHCSTARRGARKGRFVPDERRSLRPAESFGHAMLTCSGPANAGSTNGSLGLCCINLAISRATARWKHLRWPSKRPGKRLSDIPAS